MLKSFRVVSVVGTVSFRRTSSSIATDPSTSSLSRGYIILPPEIRTWDFFLTCQTLIGAGKVDNFLFKGQIGYAVQKNGLQCLMVLTIPRE